MNRNNSLFINSKDIETNSNPNFTDVQAFLSYAVNPKLKIDFLGNYALNNYKYIPKTSVRLSPVNPSRLFRKPKREDLSSNFGSRDLSCFPKKYCPIPIRYVKRSSSISLISWAFTPPKRGNQLGSPLTRFPTGYRISHKPVRPF